MGEGRGPCAGNARPRSGRRLARRLGLGAWVCAAAALGGALRAWANPGEPSPRPLSVDRFELSGAARVAGGVLLADDERVGSVLFLSDEALTGDGALRARPVKLARPRKASRPFAPRPRLIALQDFEGLASDGADTVYLLASHAGKRTKRGLERRPDREGIVRARWRKGELVVEAWPEPGGRDLATGLLAAARRAAPDRFGPDVLVEAEGLALRGPSELLVGLRRPRSARGEALVLRIAAGSLFGAAEGHPPPRLLRLDLDGQGVRGLCWDPDRACLWVLGGPHAGGARAAGFALWRCRLEDRPPERVHTFAPAWVRRYGAPEAILRYDDRRLLVAVDGRGEGHGGLFFLDA